VSDIDDAYVRQFARKDGLDPAARHRIETVQRVVKRDPARLLQNDTAYGQGRFTPLQMLG
jgi:hypothetical protein